MPIDYKTYPDDWKETVRKVLLRAGGEEEDPRIGARCEWCDAENYKPNPKTGSRVVLTTAHIHDSSPMADSLDNLASLCQLCHLGYDAPMKAINRAKKKRAAEILSGQLTLF